MKTEVLCLDYAPDQSLNSVLSHLPPSARDVLLCGPLPADSLAGLVPWIYAPAVMERWEDDGTYLGQEEDRAPTIALRQIGRQVRLRWASAWSDADLPADEMQAALWRLNGLLSRTFRNPALNFASPVALGRHLMASAWRLDNIMVPPAPPEVREILTEHSPQGRHECLTLAEVEEIPALYCYDMRLAYLWCCKGLPFGAVEWRERGDPMDAHKIVTDWIAPEEWRHIGLLPQRQQGWAYPLTGGGLVDQREYTLAGRQGWGLLAARGLRWEHEGALDRWSDGLQGALRATREEKPVYRMLRRVALNAIGSLHRSSVRRHRSLPKGRESDLPQGNPTLRMSEDGSVYFWYEEMPISARGLLYVHPEWTSTIWARCRARLTQAALQFPREQVIALRQDALFVTHPHPTWGDDGAVGRFRLKESYPGPLPAPRNLDDLQALRREGTPDD